MLQPVTLGRSYLRNKKAAVRAGILFYLISIGVIGAATIILFSVASLSLLRTSKEPLMGARIGDNAFRIPDGNTAPIPAQTYSPTLESAKIRTVSHHKVHLPDISEVGGAKAGVELPSPDRDVSTTNIGGPRCCPDTGSRIIKTRSAEVSGSEPTTIEQHASRGTKPIKIPDAGHDL